MSEACEIPLKNAPDEEVRQILSDAKVIAIVGLSDKPERDSYGVAGYLQENGYRIIPVNPNVTEVLGEKAYASLRDVPEGVDTVVIFRRVEAVPGIVDDAIAIGAKTIWMQERIVHNESADKARDAGLQVVMNKCMLKEHRAALL
jgi:predicted CoA-binding protein